MPSRFEQRVEPYRRLDVGERDENARRLYASATAAVLIGRVPRRTSIA